VRSGRSAEEAVDFVADGGEGGEAQGASLAVLEVLVIPGSRPRCRDPRVGSGGAATVRAYRRRILVSALAGEPEAVTAALNRLRTLADRFSSQPLVDSLTQLVGILGDFALDSTRTILDALLDFLSEVAAEALEALDTPVHIPVLSDILNDIGIPDVSFLDILCWICAVPTTIAYKLAKGSAPFPDTPQTKFLIGVDHYGDLTKAFANPAPSAASEPFPMEAAARLPDADAATNAGDRSRCRRRRLRSYS
jgi:hypothetical protein